MDYQSKGRLLGIPLLHISRGDGFEKRWTVGWIASGDMACGLLWADGLVAVGTVSWGMLSLGLVAVGPFCAGAMVFAAIGFGAIAGCAVGCGGWVLAAAGVAFVNGFGPHVITFGDIPLAPWFSSFCNYFEKWGGIPFIVAGILVLCWRDFLTAVVKRHQKGADEKS